MRLLIYDFSGKTPAIVAELNGVNEPLPVQTPKATKMLYDLGAGVVVKKGNMELEYIMVLTLLKIPCTKRYFKT
ncbi:MAG TPA: hypothetical protein LFV90_01310 [Rickettsia endosymbiont of Columbicola hoogstraali]|nr:hypothetical protein [Rickettsia endosymbiont of Columbicola hoogstraali]